VQKFMGVQEEEAPNPTNNSLLKAYSTHIHQQMLILPAPDQFKLTPDRRLEKTKLPLMNFILD